MSSRRKEVATLLVVLGLALAKHSAAAAAALPPAAAAATLLPLHAELIELFNKPPIDPPWCCGLQRCWSKPLTRKITPDILFFWISTSSLLFTQHNQNTLEHIVN
jgi:hypothetical protein